jgi:late competence protein required for DNA uptake (superfamily II DNA/RNA helicase)
MGAARLHWQVLKLHVCARCCHAAAAVSQTAYKCSAVTCRISICMHAAAVDLLQWQDTKLQWQDTKLQWQDTKL